MSLGSIKSIEGRCIPLQGTDIDTDRIIPARFLRCVTFDGLGEHVFEDDRKQDSQHPFNQSCYQGASILLVGRNFGCGSSREHAPQSLYRWGIRAIVGVSFAEIFFGNCNAMGIPCICVSDEDLEKLSCATRSNPSINCRLDIAASTATMGAEVVQGRLPAGVRVSFLEGSWNATKVLLEAEDLIETTASGLPYVRSFAG